jgi:hypothetical protein
MPLHQRDYLLRMIEQLGRVLARIRNEMLGRVEEGDPVSEDDLAELARGAGMDLGLVRRLVPETLQMLVASGGEPDPARAWSWGEILFLDALLAERRGDPARARASRERARALFQVVNPGWKAPGESVSAAERIAELERDLAVDGTG